MNEIQLSYIVVALAAALITLTVCFIGLLIVAVRTVPSAVLERIWTDSVAVASTFVAAMANVNVQVDPQSVLGAQANGNGNGHLEESASTLP
jgi:steroid 5-alpha reductase family enzyme